MMIYGKRNWNNWTLWLELCPSLPLPVENQTTSMFGKYHMHVARKTYHNTARKFLLEKILPSALVGEIFTP